MPGREEQGDGLPEGAAGLDHDEHAAEADESGEGAAPPDALAEHGTARRVMIRGAVKPTA